MEDREDKGHDESSSETQGRDHPSRPPVDGPSAGTSGDDKEETGAGSYDKPGDSEGSDAGHR